MRYLSLFSGIGGFEKGIQQAYETIRNTNVQEKRGGQETTKGELQEDGERLHPISEQTTLSTSNWNNEYFNRSINERQPTCIGFSEIDKYATQIYKQHYPEHKNYGDITKINTDELPDFDLLVGGFPCQAFSIAGKRKGFEDTRGTLFFEIARILKAKQPRLFCLENVKGLLSHDNGNTFRIIISTLNELGYDLQWQVLNSKNHGVPQNRERVFIIGHLRGTSRPEVFPFRDNPEATTQLSGQHSNTLTTRYYGGQANGTYVLESKLDAQEDLMIRDGRDNRSCLRSGRTPELGVKGMSIRRLTPTECERLQGFPDNWTEVVSDTQRYKTLGNAVTVNVIQDIMEILL